jgi:hypothetical protein
MTNFDIRKKLYDEKMQQMDDELPPIPMISSDVDTGGRYFKDDGLVWENVEDPGSPYAQDFYKSLLS